MSINIHIKNERLLVLIFSLYFPACVEEIYSYLYRRKPHHIFFVIDRQIIFHI